MWRDVAQTVFRMAPWPTATGLRAIGQPGPQSPVLVTANYDLTVRRVERALEGCDAWLVVAPASGINVWCAAAGGHFGTHQVVTALKTSGVADRVAHRRVVLPQLAATGVERLELKRRCGWTAHFGPVHAEDLPEYLARDGQKDDAMRRVRFSGHERSEMALAWGGPAALLIALGSAWLSPRFALPGALLALFMSFALFFLYDRLPGPRRLVFTALGVATAGLAGLALGGGEWLVSLPSAAVVLAFILTVDYEGSTPLEGGSHFAERRFEIRLDPARCKGVYACWEVCPEACFEKPDPAARVEVERAAGSGRPKIEIAHADRCVRCGACIVQCPLDALAFESEDGERIEPETIRRYKLDLLGSRSVGAEPS